MGVFGKIKGKMESGLESINRTEGGGLKLLYTHVVYIVRQILSKGEFDKKITDKNNINTVLIDNFVYTNFLRYERARVFYKKDAAGNVTISFIIPFCSESSAKRFFDGISAEIDRQSGGH